MFFLCFGREDFDKEVEAHISANEAYIFTLLQNRNRIDRSLAPREMEIKVPKELTHGPFAGNLS